MEWKSKRKIYTLSNWILLYFVCIVLYRIELDAIELDWLFLLELLLFSRIRMLNFSFGWQQARFKKNWQYYSDKTESWTKSQAKTIRGFIYIISSTQFIESVHTQAISAATAIEAFNCKSVHRIASSSKSKNTDY